MDMPQMTTYNKKCYITFPLQLILFLSSFSVVTDQGTVVVTEQGANVVEHYDQSGWGRSGDDLVHCTGLVLSGTMLQLL